MRFVALLLLAFVLHPSLALATGKERQNLTFTTGQGVPYIFSVEVALTPEDQRKGLMGRRALGPDEGMLFVKDHPQVIGLWMKNTLIPLDMLFVRTDGTLSSIHAEARPLDRTIIRSIEPVIAVIEIPAGRAAALGLEPGTRVEAPALSPKPRLEH